MGIKIDNEKRIHLYNRDFDEMRSTLDTAIQSVIAQVIQKGMDAGTVTLKINMSLQRESVEDRMASSGFRPAIHPEIDYKVGYTMQQKGSIDGEIVSKGSDELLIGDDGNFYLVSPREASGQLSMFNTWDEYAGAVTK